MADESRDAPAAAAGAPRLDDEYSLRLCRVVAGWRYADLPADVVQTVKRLLLDVLGAIAGATDAPGIGELNGRLSRWEAGGSATGLVGMRRYSPPTAALANGAAAHALDFDDQHDPARAHTSCVMAPALLATAEDAAGVSGRDFILAFAIGAELQARLGVACHNSLRHGWHPTMTFGTLAASIAAGRLLGLGAEGLRNALGIAYHQASGSAQSMRDGVLSKRLGPGFAARSAVLSAFLAADGLTGTRRPLEGNAGLLALYERGAVNAEAITRRLGDEWFIREYSFKPFPCCRCNHTTIGIGIALNRQGIVPESVRQVEIGLGTSNWMTVGEPYDPGRGSVVHAQFNAAYGFARALFDGRVDLESYRTQALGDPGVVALASRTRVFDDATIDPATQTARVRVTLTDGRVVEVLQETMKGSPEDPMSDAELLAKFHGCLAYGVGAPHGVGDALVDAVMNLEAAPDAAQVLVRAFAAAAQSDRSDG